MILLIDNYDSFTYNVYQMIGEKHPEIRVVRNDMIRIDQIIELSPDQIILSPGPGYPAQAGQMPQIINYFHDKIPLLGICLGHQGIAESFGGRIIEANVPMHGKSSEVEISVDDDIFAGIPNKIKAGRYHSLTVDRDSLPGCLEVIACSTDDDQIMAIKHKKLPVYGLQFHPESILSEFGSQILDNFICRCKTS